MGLLHAARGLDDQIEGIQLLNELTIMACRPCSWMPPSRSNP